MERSETLEIVGAGPAGLAAAITAAKAGYRAVVYERSHDVGSRFHGDFQGIENWTAERDALEELASLGIEPTFRATPFREQHFFKPDGREHVFRSPQPFYYLVQRGPGPGTLDRSLKDQALAAGVEIRFGHTVRKLPEGSVVATGPRHATVIGAGYLFETDLDDGAWAVIDDRLAPKGYGYLLVDRGRATLSTCIFTDFRNTQRYLERTVKFFADRLHFSMINPRRFSGAGNFFRPRPASAGPLLAGEAAGFQDALWGFGIRYALLSGHLAMKAKIEGNPRGYHHLWENRLGGYLRSGWINRFVFGRAGATAYRYLIWRLSRSSDPRRVLQRIFAPSGLKDLAVSLLGRALVRDETASRERDFRPSLTES